MLQVVSFTFNPFQENTYLLINEKKECWIIDPGMMGKDEENILTQYIAENQLLPQQIINTHTHIDHILGINFLKGKYNIQFGMHQADLPVLNSAMGSAMMFGIPLSYSPTPDFFIEENKMMQLGSDELEVRFAPGHSPGSIVFYSKDHNFVIAGDVLFQNSIGRTDLPGGNHVTLLQSIKEQLYTLPNDTIVYPGHGESTTIQAEKSSNPFVRG